MAGDVLILSSAAIFAAMRMYALFHQSWSLFGFTLTLGLINPMISMYTFIISTPVLLHITPTYQTCSIHTANASNLYVWMMGARAASVVFDSFVFFLTWRGTKFVGMHKLKKTLLVDTTVYFGFLFILNLGGICIAIAQLLFIDAISTLTAV
ncbi:hypothetical protein DAEQUDRAFT_731593 [Daedalea quercina L-15889]|uniref:Uncharacterized protein n=1 Tax=Daedalea quercina L-15889 TaxID=1314783 RepID=A0A165M7G4_9APHY|nr:hypothetical protein DAEQUDRAFT_731593 [Daedalea quercina L-15889]